MKIKHRVPPLELKSDPITPEYQAEVDACTARLERQHYKALKALEAIDQRAERIRLRLERAAAKRITRQAKRAEAEEQAKLARMVADREAELCAVERLMVPADHASRDRRRRVVRLESGIITIPLGGTTGQKPKAPSTTQHELHVLYRFFDAHNDLLYVGITCNPGARIQTHARQKMWWLEMASMTAEHFPSRRALQRAELEAIRAEDPRYNIVGKVNVPVLAGHN